MLGMDTGRRGHEMNDDGDILVVKQLFHRFYMCDACGTVCYFCVTNDHNSLPPPGCCPYNFPGDVDYDDEFPKPNWRVASNEKHS